MCLLKAWRLRVFSLFFFSPSLFRSQRLMMIETCIICQSTDGLVTRTHKRKTETNFSFLLLSRRLTRTSHPLAAQVRWGVMMHNLLRWIRLDGAEEEGRARGGKKKKKKKREKREKRRQRKSGQRGSLSICVRGFFPSKQSASTIPQTELPEEGNLLFGLHSKLIVGSSGALDFLRQEAR